MITSWKDHTLRSSTHRSNTAIWLVAVIAAFAATGLSACSSPQSIRGCTLQAQTQCVRVDLSNQDLSGSDLQGANLTGANFGKANLSGADLQGANLANANFIGANLIGANLTGADMTDVSISNANFTSANLDNVKLDSGSASGANFTDANPSALQFVVYGGMASNITCPNGQITSSDAFIDCANPLGNPTVDVAILANTYISTSSPESPKSCVPTDPVAFLSQGNTFEVQKPGMPTLQGELNPISSPTVGNNLCQITATINSPVDTVRQYTGATLVANGQTFFTFPSDKSPFGVAGYREPYLAQVNNNLAFVLKEPGMR